MPRQQRHILTALFQHVQRLQISLKITIGFRQQGGVAASDGIATDDAFKLRFLRLACPHEKAHRVTGVPWGMSYL